jgi:hypothetical protein
MVHRVIAYLTFMVQEPEGLEEKGEKVLPVSALPPERDAEGIHLRLVAAFSSNPRASIVAAASTRQGHYAFGVPP